MNYYEHTLITKQDLQENKVKAFINKYIDIINNNSGKVIKTENWGLKNFSHKIKNNKKGFYFHIKFEGIGKTIDELEKAENIDQMLIRYLTVRVKVHDLESSFCFFNDTEVTREGKILPLSERYFFNNLIFL